MKAFKSFSRWLRNRKQPQFAGLVVFTAVFAVIGVTLLLRSFAAGEKLYITPGSIDVQPGQDFTVTLRLESGSAGINAVNASITYDSSKIQYKSHDTSANGFTAATNAYNAPITDVSKRCPTIDNSGNSGNVFTALQGTCGTVSGDVEVAKITFTALAQTTTTAALTITGEAGTGSGQVTLGIENGTVNIAAQTTPPPSSGATYTIEPTLGSPVVGTQFGLRVYVTSDTPMQGGEVSVVLPSGLAYQGTLDTAGTAFNPTTTVTGTTAQRVNLVFVTQATNLTGKQLVGTIPVTASTAGAKSVTFENARVVGLDDANITPVTANAFSITATAAALPAPQVRKSGSSQNIAATENVTDLKQAFTIANFDNSANYTVVLGGQTLPVSGNGFSIPASLHNGDLPLLITVSKDGASGNASHTVRLRSPNVDRVACTGLDDLLRVNGGYGAASTDFDLNFDGTVSLIDLLTVTQNWTGACV